MDMRTLWLYGLALASLVWGLFGLRTALAMLAANTVLAAILCFVPNTGGFATILSVGYPFYLFMAFFLFSFIECIDFPVLSAAKRIVLSLVGCLVFAALINWDLVSYNARLAYAAYGATVEERPRLIHEAFADAGYGLVCLDSNATLLRLALGAKDQATTAVLFDAFDRCHRASVTVEKVVKPLLDSGDMEQIGFLIENGLKPSTLVFGQAYRGSALAYAARVAKNPKLVMALLSRYPEKARSTPFIGVLLNDLKNNNELEMLELFEKNGLAGEQ